MGRLMVRKAAAPGLGRGTIIEAADIILAAGFVIGLGVAIIAEGADIVLGSGVGAVTGGGGINESVDIAGAFGAPIGGIGVVSVSGSAAINESGDLIAGVGFISSNIGNGAFTETKDTVIGVGFQATSIGSGAVTEQNDSIAGVGTTAVAGLAAITESSDSAAGLGTVKVTGNGAITETVDFVLGVGSLGTAGYKFNPGDYAVASNATYGVTLAMAQSDINLLVATGTLGVKGYAFTEAWHSLESGVNSQSPTYNFSVIDNILNYLWQQWPAARAGLFLFGNNYGGGSGGATQVTITTTNYNDAGFYIPAYVTACGGTLTVPSGYLSGTSVAYAVAPDYPGGPNYGADWGNHQVVSGTQYMEQFSPQWHNAGVMKAFTNMAQALSQHAMVLPNVPAYNGMTLDQCPAFEFLHINDEVSNYWSSANNFTSGIGDNINPPASVTGSPATVQGFWTQHTTMYSALTSYFPHTLVGCCDSWQVQYGASEQTASDMAACINANLPGPRSAPYALSTIIGLAFDQADMIPNSFIAGQLANWQNGIQGFIGIQNPAGTFQVPTYPGLANVMPQFGQVQPNDYHIAGTGAGNNQTSVQQISAAMNHSPYTNISHGLWWMSDNTGLSSAWPNYIYPALQGAGVAGVRAAVARPSSIAKASLLITTPNPLPNAQVGFPYFLALKAALDTTPDTWTLVSDSGFGASLSSSGLLIALPTTAGTYGLVVKVVDTLGLSSGNVALSVTVVAP